MNSTTTTAPESLAKLASSDTVRLEGAICVQAGTPMLLTYALARDVVHHARVDTLDPHTKKGYQRSANTTRMNAAARYYQKGGRMPNPLLVNVREQDFNQVKIVITSGNRDGYEAAIGNDEASWIGSGYIEFDKDLPIWVFDGQHRKGGIEITVVEDAIFSDFPVPLSICLGLNQPEEMKEFYEVNTNAKSVPTDLAWQLLREMAQNDPDLAAMLEENDKAWITRAVDVVAELETLGGPWTGRIQSPNQKKVRNDGLTIPQAQLVRSLKPVLDMALLKRADAATVAKLVNAYWEGIAQVLPEPFEATTNPSDWVIQKGPGATALHRILTQVIEVIRAQGKPLGDPASYADVLENIKNLTGDKVIEDGSIIPTSGADFWRVGSAASAYTGDSGRKRLALRIQALLPKPTDQFSL